MTVETKTFGVLLADDVPDLRLLVRMALESVDHFRVIAEAEDGIQAVDLAGLHKPDLVILDISMPRQDGLSSLPKILEASPNSKVIILSGFEAERLASMAHDLGAVSYLEKGVPPAQLLAAAEDAVGLATETRGSHVVTLEEAAGDSAQLPDAELLAFLSHEIRNPLAVIQGFGLTLQDRWDSMQQDQRRDLVRRMTAQAAYLDSVLTNVLHLRSGHLADTDVRWSTHDPGDLLAQLLHELSPLAKDHPVRLSMSDDARPIRVDSHRLRQVLTNLIVNATKYSSPGSPIEIRGIAVPGAVQVEVSDAGTGIPRDMREVVFEKFRRMDETGKGLGLGLYICRQLMKAMDGDIWIGDSSEGTTICLRLPLAESP